MSNKRIFIKKRQGYNKEELQLKNTLNLEYNLDLDNVQVYVIYDIYNIDEETYKLAKTSVFSEVVVDEVFESIDLEEGKYFAYEVLPAQYDQRADSATQCIKLLNAKSEATVRSGKLVIFDKKLNSDELKLVENYLVNPIEARVKDLSVLEFSLNSEPKPLKKLDGFLEYSHLQLEAVKKESKEDFLTKTATKRALIEELERIEEKYKRYGSDYSVCFFDIDHFKKINDTYGHEAGDVILASVGQLLRKYSRQVDFVGRYGGEEFVVLLPEIPLANGINLANKLREILQNAKFMYKDERISVTASCGVSVRSANSSWMLTIEEADKMLYLAKQSGRNRVMPEIVNAKNK